MKQILKINDNEKLRILEMHKSSTKRHYLNENTSSVPSPPSGLISDVQSDLDKFYNPIKNSIPFPVRKLFGIDRVFKDVFNEVINTIPEVYKGMSELSGSSRCRGALCGQREESSGPASLQCVAWLPAFCLASTGSLCSCI